MNAKNGKKTFLVIPLLGNYYPEHVKGPKPTNNSITKEVNAPFPNKCKRPINT